MAEGMIMAQDALSLMLCTIEDEGGETPLSSIGTVSTKDEKETIHYIACDTDAYRRMIGLQNALEGKVHSL